MLKALCKWRSLRCATLAIRAMNRMDYKSAKDWLSRANRWERLGKIGAFAEHGTPKED